jgi:putative hydrolase of the HAD superfamily
MRIAAGPARPTRVRGGFRMIRAVLFDLDDTLFDHRHGARQALAAVRTGHDALIRLDPADFERRHAEILEVLHLRVLAKEIGLDEARRQRFRTLLQSAGVWDAAAVDRAAAAYRDCYIESWREVPGATALLRALAGRMRIGIVSNNLTREQQEKLRFCGFDTLVDAVVISEEAGASKPDPAIFRVALDRIGTSAAETIMVGDAWRTDIAGARAAGIRAIWFNPAGVPRPDPWDGVGEIRSLEPSEVFAAITAVEEQSA